MKVLRNLFYPILMLSLLASCDISDNEAEPSDSFLKIYDNDRFEASFIPIDVKQTPDGGYIILGARRIEDSDFSGVYLLKTDENGKFIAEENLTEQFIHPIKSLLNIGGEFYFVAMADISLQANLIKVDSDSLTISATPIGGLSYPLHASQDGDNLMLLSYNNSSNETVFSIVRPDGSISNTISSTIGAGADVEEPIIDHFTRTGKQLPFFTGKTDGGLYFANGYFNYTLSVAFTNFNQFNIAIQGQQDDGGISAMTNLNGNQFALAKFNFGDNYLLPVQEVNSSALSSSTDLEGKPFPELVPDAPVALDAIDIDGRKVILYGSNTKSGQIVLLAFNSADGTLFGTRYIGFADPYEIASFTQTDDGGLAIVGTVYVAGRFGRICLIKLSPDELADFAQ